MRQIIKLLIGCFVFGVSSLVAQNPGSGLPQHFFDPERDPVVIRQGKSMQLYISEYLIAKSVRARIGRQCDVTKVYTLSDSGREYLIIEGQYQSDQLQYFQLNIPLMADKAGKYWYAGSEAGSCQSTSCSNCGKPPACATCCGGTDGSRAQSIRSPLLKVTTEAE
jgi:hypothetical protein